MVHCKSGPMTVQDSLAQFTVFGDGVTRPAFRKVFVSILCRSLLPAALGPAKAAIQLTAITFKICLFAFTLMLFQEAVVSMLGIETHRCQQTLHFLLGS